MKAVRDDLKATREAEMKRRMLRAQRLRERWERLTEAEKDAMRVQFEAEEPSSAA